MQPHLFAFETEAMERLPMGQIFEFIRNLDAVTVTQL